MSIILQAATLLAIIIAVFSVSSINAHVLKHEADADELVPGIHVAEIKKDTMLMRNRRFVEGDQPNLNPANNQQKQQGWEINPNLKRNDQGTVRGDVSVQNHGENHDFEATWGQNLRGPQKHSEQWSVGGRYRW